MKGYPFNDDKCIDYKEFRRDFVFVTYKDVIAGGILRSKLLFNTSFSELEAHKLNFGQRMQWFTAEIVAPKNPVIIDGKSHFPFLAISYSYDTVNAIKYEIGIYRTKCSNGLVFGFKFLWKTTINPENLFEFDFLYNPCTLLALFKEYERSVLILKKTKLTRETIYRLMDASLNFDNNSINLFDPTIRQSPQILKSTVGSLIDKYILELGLNAYAVLNVITDMASNNIVDQMNRIIKIDDTILAKRRQAGLWLDQFIRFIEFHNEIKMITDLQSDKLGSKPEKEIYNFDLAAFEAFIHS